MNLLFFGSSTMKSTEFDILKQSLEIRGKVGVLHERPSYPKSMTALKFLTMAGKLYKNRRPAKELLSIVGLSDAADRKIGNYSAGMYQRLGIAHALVGKPEIIFLDEPTSNLDVDGRELVSRLITDIYHESGTSFFISSHILTELERTCQSVAFMKEGRIVEIGLTKETIQKHTESRYRIVTSDSRKLYEGIGDLHGIIRSKITGINTVTVIIKPNKLESFKTDAQRIASDLGITIYAFEVAESLEDAYWEVMQDEQ